MSMTKEQFVKFVHDEVLSVNGQYPPINLAHWIWDNLLEEEQDEYEGMVSVKEYIHCVPEEERQRLRQEYEAEQRRKLEVHREARRQRVIERAAEMGIDPELLP